MLNNCTIMGRLVRDPELRRTGSGVAVTSFTIACERDFSSKDDGERETDFIDCVAWRATGEFIAKYFAKGRMIVVNGRMQSRKWTDKENNKRVSTELNVDNCYFGDSKKPEGASNQDQQYGGNPNGKQNGNGQQYGGQYGNNNQYGGQYGGQYGQGGGYGQGAGNNYGTPSGGYSNGYGVPNGGNGYNQPPQGNEPF